MAANDKPKDPNAQALGKKGGAARALKLSREQRSYSAKRAAEIRWKRVKGY